MRVDKKWLKRYENNFFRVPVVALTPSIRYPRKAVPETGLRNQKPLTRYNRLSGTRPGFCRWQMRLLDQTSNHGQLSAPNCPA